MRTLRTLRTAALACLQRPQYGVCIMARFFSTTCRGAALQTQGPEIAQSSVGLQVTSGSTDPQMVNGVRCFERARPTVGQLHTRLRTAGLGLRERLGAAGTGLAPASWWPLAAEGRGKQMGLDLFGSVSMPRTYHSTSEYSHPLQICTYTRIYAYTYSPWTLCIVCGHCAHTRLPGYGL